MRRGRYWCVLARSSKATIFLSENTCFRTGPGASGVSSRPGIIEITMPGYHSHAGSLKYPRDPQRDVVLDPLPGE